MAKNRPQLRFIAIPVAAALVLTGALIGGYALLAPHDETAPTSAPAPGNEGNPSIPTNWTVDETPEPPTALSQKELAVLPLADTWAVIPSLLDQDDVATSLSEGYSAIATPLQPLTGLYSEIATDASPIAALSNISVEDQTRVAVYDSRGGWILVGTPSRIALPSASGGNAPTVSFAWARAADFVMDEPTNSVVVDTSASTITLLDAESNVVHTESATLGSAAAPTPTNTHAYIVASYTDAAQPWTSGQPIILLSSHSATLDSFNNDPAPTGIHYSTAKSANSKGCVRVSPEMAQMLDPLIGVKVTFTDGGNV